MGTTETTPLRLHAADALRRARRLPVGPARNDLRQLAISLRELDKRGVDTRIGIVLASHDLDSVWFSDARPSSFRE